MIGQTQFTDDEILAAREVVALGVDLPTVAEMAARKTSTELTSTNVAEPAGERRPTVSGWKADCLHCSYEIVALRVPGEETWRHHDGPNPGWDFCAGRAGYDARYEVTA